MKQRTIHELMDYGAKLIVLDTETGTGKGTKAGPSPYNPDYVPLVVSGVGVMVKQGTWLYRKHKELKELLQTSFSKNPAGVVFIGHNIKFDILHWLANGIITVDELNKVVLFDTSLAEFRMTGHLHKYPSLKDLCIKYDVDHKTDKVKEFWDAGIDTQNIPSDILDDYLKNDVEITKQVFQEQLDDLKKKGDKFGRMLMLDMEALKAACIVEHNGMSINVSKFYTYKNYLMELKEEKEAEINTLAKKEICSKPVTLSVPDGYTVDHKVIIDINYDDSPTSIAKFILYNQPLKIKLPCTKVDASGNPELYKSGKKKGKPKTHKKDVVITPSRIISSLPDNPLSSKTLEGLSHPFAKALSDLNAINKELSGYFEGLIPFLSSEVANEDSCVPVGDIEGLDFFHGNLNFTDVGTGRLSSSKPNLQNISNKEYIDEQN